MNIKKLRLKLITFGVLLIASVMLVLVGVSNAGENPTYYTSPEDDSVIFKVEDGSYFLNDVKLERVKTTILQNLLGSLKIFLPMLPYLLGAILCVFLAFRLGKKLPPPFVWSSILLGERKKEYHNDRISLRQAPGGLIAWRAWEVDKLGTLYSTAKGTRWDSVELKADLIPAVGGWHGVYAHRLGTGEDVRGPVVGIVSLSGRIVGHKDSLLRAQKCTILLLITKKDEVATLLRQRYKCPVVMTRNIRQALCNWTISEEGIFWLSHNERLISQKLQDALEHDIAELPAYQEFQGEV